MKKRLIVFICTGTVWAFNPESPEHIRVRRLLGERKITQEQFFETLKQINNATQQQKITDTMLQRRIRAVIEKS